MALSAVVVVVGGLVGGLPVVVTFGGGAVLLSGAAYVFWLGRWVPRKLGPPPNSDT
jgi:hypothetical protein